MEGKNLKLITQILAILTICLIAFVGVYKQNNNKMQNEVKGYGLSKDLLGYRELIFKISDATQVVDSEGKVVGNTDVFSDEVITSNEYQKSETKINLEEDLNLDNYQKSKSIIETRLKKLGVEDYNIGLNTEDGTIYLQIPEDDTTDHTVSNILQIANFQIADSEDSSKIYLTNNDIKNVSAIYNTTESGTTVYLDIKFNEKGKNTLKEISSGEYAKVEETEEQSDEENNQNNVDVQAEATTETSNETESNETTNNNQTENNTSNENSENNENESNEDSTSEDTENNEEENAQKQITLSIDDNDMITTSFDEPIEDGIIDLSMSQATTDQSAISSTLQSASTIAILVNSGKMPLTYTVSANNYINSDISENTVQRFIYVVAIVIIILLLCLITKYKLQGLIAGVAYIGFVALYSLLVRYTNVSISIESIIATIIILGINYMLTYRLLKTHEADVELKKIVYSREFKSTITKLIPIFIIAVVFAFIKWTKIATFGMFMFWGVFLIIIYNYFITRDMLD